MQNFLLPMFLFPSFRVAGVFGSYVSDMSLHNLYFIGCVYSGFFLTAVCFCPTIRENPVLHKNWDNKRLKVIIPKKKLG